MSPMNESILADPSMDLLPGCVDALRRGWSRTTVEPERLAREDLEAIDRDPGAFVASLDDPEGRGAPVRLPDGSTRPRLPGFFRWIVDGEFCGNVGMRWQAGTASLPPHVLGHVGFMVVPWKRGRGYASRALGFLLPEARRVGLPFVELTTDPDNVASQKVIAANGGFLVERFRKDPVYGDAPALRFRIDLGDVVGSDGAA